MIVKACGPRVCVLMLQQRVSIITAALKVVLLLYIEYMHIMANHIMLTLSPNDLTVGIQLCIVPLYIGLLIPHT